MKADVRSTELTDHLARAIEEMLANGDLIGASRAVEAERVTESCEPNMLVAAGRVFALRGRWEQAALLIDRALETDPRFGPAYVERARAALVAGDLVRAREWFERAYRKTVSPEPWMAEWIDILIQCGDFKQALDVAQRCLESTPNNAESWFQIGLLYQRVNRYDEALQAYGRAQTLDAGLPMLANNIAAALLQLSDWTHAESILRLTVRNEPENPLAWTNLSVALLKLGDLLGSEVAAERACMLAPEYPIAWQSYSYILKEKQQWTLAREAAERALRIEPDNPSLAWGLAMLQLKLGDYDKGWLNHEARWRGSAELRDVLPSFPSPRWEGESLKGKTLFVWGEQGFGDAIQFVRFVPLLAERVRHEGGRLVFCCFAHLLPLFARSLMGVVDDIVPHDLPSLPKHDVNIPLGSLPLLLNIKVGQLPVATSYIRADMLQMHTWAERMGMRTPRALRVGLVWSGSRMHQRNSLCSIDPLEYARAFGGITGIEFVNLQKDAADEVCALRAAGLSLVDVTDMLENFDDTAALLVGLDLVITVCTSIAHLAGAMGLRTWLLLDVNPHWTWMTERSDSLWYPSVTLYRQSEYKCWAPVLTQVSMDLRHYADSKEGQVTEGYTATTRRSRK